MKTTPLPLLAIAVVALALVGGCAEGSSLPSVPDTIVPSGDAGTSTTTTAEPAGGEDGTVDDTTTTSTFARLVEPPTSEPPYEAVTITTEDGIDLFGRFWEGDDVAVLYTHEYDAAQAGGGGQRPPQSSDTLGPNTWTLAADGLTVLAIDFRGHGMSEGTYSVKGSRIDMKAAYDFLVERGYTTIVGMAAGGSAPVMADLSAFDGDVDFAGLGMLFTPLAETGYDAGNALAQVDEPVWLVGIDVGSFGGVTKRLEPSVNTLFERFIFPPVPSGVQFADVYGAEWLGRQLDFVDAVSGR